jgi:hypothetical protein
MISIFIQEKINNAKDSIDLNELTPNPLFEPIKLVDLTYVEYLLQQGAKTNKNFSTYTYPALLISLSISSYEMTRLLLEYGADINEDLNELSETPIAFCFKKHLHSFIPLLLKYNPNLIDEYETYKSNNPNKIQNNSILLGSDKKEENEIRRMIQPQQHPRNGMPPMNRHPMNQQQYNHMQAQHRQQMYNQQQAQQQGHDQQEEPDADAADADTSDVQQPSTNTNTPPVTATSAAKKAASKPNANPAGTVNGATAEEKALSDKAEADAEAASKFTRVHPHPAIMKPADTSSQSQAQSQPSSVDDVMQKTEALLNASKTVGYSGVNSNMTEADRALLDKVQQAVDNEEDDDEDDEDDA